MVFVESVVALLATATRTNDRFIRFTVGDVCPPSAFELPAKISLRVKRAEKIHWRDYFSHPIKRRSLAANDRRVNFELPPLTRSRNEKGRIRN
jgi:hypothetical protein